DDLVRLHRRAPPLGDDGGSIEETPGQGRVQGEGHASRRERIGSNYNSVMRQLSRILSYAKPYTVRFFVGIVCMALVGLLEGFRILLIGPVLDKVLNPRGQTLSGTVYAPNADNPNDIVLFKLPWSDHTFHLNLLVPSQFHNPWAM